MVGGGFAGIEVFAELRSFASALVGKYHQLTFDDTHFHLIEAMGRIMPEVSRKTSEWVLRNLAQRGAYVHLDTQLTSAVDGNVELSTGETFESDLIVWTAGVMANPVVARQRPAGRGARPHPHARRPAGRQRRRVVEGAWAAGDVSAVPDLIGGGVGGYCVPNAQHAVRQAKLLAKNLVAVLRGEVPREYFHKNLGAVAGLGLYDGVFQSGAVALKGLIAWVAHRGYHGLAMPTWERKFRVFGEWIINFLARRDLVGIPARDTPRAVFEEFALRPKAAAAGRRARGQGRPPSRQYSPSPSPSADNLSAGSRSPTGRGRRLKIAQV